MRPLVIVLLCLGTALAEQDLFGLPEYNTIYEPEYIWQRSYQESAFTPNRQYHYFYDGQILTGIPGSSKEHAGTRIQCLVVFSVRQSNEVLMQLEHVRMGKLNRKVPHPRVVLPFRAYEEVSIREQLKQTLRKPVKFLYENGLVRDIHLEQGEQPWSANIKRSVLNLIQVALQERQQHCTDCDQDQIMTNDIVQEQSHRNRFFRVNEKTLEGHCETAYQVSKLPCRHCSQQVFNITKSINFEQCQKRPQIRYNWRFSDHCPSCDPKYSQHEKYLTSSTVIKYNISGTRESFMIEQAKAESHYTFVMLNEQANVINSYVNQTLVLIRSGRSSHQVSELQNPIKSDSGMVATLDWDIAKEKFFRESDSEFHQDTPFPAIQKLSVAKDLLRKLAHHMSEQVQTTAPRIFSRLVTMCRYMTKSQLEQLCSEVESFTPEQKKKAKDVLMTALASAGTLDSIQVVSEKIRQSQVTQFESVSAIAQLSGLRVVSKQMIEEVQQLCESSRVSQKQWIKQQCWLSLGSMMSALCKPSRDHWALQFKHTGRSLCPRQTKQELVEMLASKLRASSSWENKILFLKALGNTGIDLAVPELERIIRDPQQPALVRSEAILCLRQLAMQMPKKIQKMLMPMYMNRWLHPLIRMCAAHICIHTQPERPVLEIMAKNLNTEPSRQVASFVYTEMSSIANSTQPCFKNLSTNMISALRFTKRRHSWLLTSSFHHIPMHSHFQKVGLDLNLAKAFSNHSLIPMLMSASINTNWLGFFTHNALRLKLMSQHPEPLIRKVLEETQIPGHHRLSQILRRHPRDTSSSYRQEIQQLLQNLDMESRSRSGVPKSYISLAWLGQDTMFAPFGLEEIQSLIEQGKEKLRTWQSQESTSVHFNKNYASLLSETQYKIQTTMGMPLVVSQKLPIVASIRGRVHNIRLQNWNMELSAEIKPSFAVRYVQSVECWSPILNSGVKVQATAKGFLPIKAQLSVDLSSQMKEFKLKFEPPTEHRELLTLETRPMTSVVTWPSSIQTWVEPEIKTIMGEEVNRVHRFERSFGKHMFGLEMKLKGFVHWTPQRHLTGTPFCPMTGPNRITLIAKPGHSRPQQIKIKLQTEWIWRLQEVLSTSFQRHFWQNEQSSEGSSSEEFSQPTISSHNKLQVNFQIKKDETPVVKAECRSQCSKGMKLCKTRCEAERAPIPQFDSQKRVVCLDSEMLYPSKPYSMQEVRGKKVLGKFNVHWGSSCSSQKFIKIKLQAERSRLQQHWERKHSERYHECRSYATDSPIACHEYLKEAGQLKKYKMEIEYQQVPVEFANITNWLWRWAKQHYFWQTDVADIHVQNPQNKIKAIVRIDPWTKQKLNITVKTPKQNVTMVDIPLPMKLTPMNLKSSIFSFSSLYPVCKVRTNRFIKTFDGQKFKLPLGTCWTVLAKDCSEHQRFAVLIKRQSQDSQHKKVKILTHNNKIVLQRQSGEIQVKVNDQPITLQEDEIETVTNNVRCTKLGSYIKCSLPQVGVRVYFDGRSCNVKMSPYMMWRQCGICGSFDNEISDEWRMPNGQLTSNLHQFVQVYTKQEAGCQMPDVQSWCGSSQQCLWEPEYWMRPDLISSESSSQEQQEQHILPQRHEVDPVSRIKFLQMIGEICFSKQSQLVCPSGSHKKTVTTHQVTYICVSENQPQWFHLAVDLQQEQQWRALSPEEIRALKTPSSTETSAQEISARSREITRQEQRPSKCTRWWY